VLGDCAENGGEKPTALRGGKRRGGRKRCLLGEEVPSGSTSLVALKEQEKRVGSKRAISHERTKCPFKEGNRKRKFRATSPGKRDEEEITVRLKAGVHSGGISEGSEEQSFQNRKKKKVQGLWAAGEEETFCSYLKRGEGRERDWTVGEGVPTRVGSREGPKCDASERPKRGSGNGEKGHKEGKFSGEDLPGHKK